jgi:hypothetical protein
MSRRVLVVATSDIEADEIRQPLHRRFGDTDVRFLGRGAPLEAIDDALRQDEIEEVVVVTRRSDEDSWREAGEVEAARGRLGVPVSHLLVA